MRQSHRGQEIAQNWPPSMSGKPRIVHDLLLAFDVQLVALFALAPLAMGGRHEIGKAVFLGLVASTVLTWLVRAVVQKQCKWSWIGAEPLLIAALLLVILQLVKLPGDWLQILSPQLCQSLPLWGGEGQSSFALGTWDTLSVAPSVTRATLIVFVAYAALFGVIAQRLQSLEDVYRLLKLIALSSIAMAVVGLMQFVSGCTEYLWFYHHPARSAAGKVTGTFTNQNHFANFVALGIGPLVWWTYRSKLRARRSQKTRFLLPLTLLGLATLSVLLSFSRGGVIVLAVSAITCMVILGRANLLNRRAMAAMAVAVCLLIVALLIHGYEPLARRMGTLIPGQSLTSASRERLDLWRADWQAAVDFVLLGSGAGTHAEVYPRYMAAQYNVRFTHAENSYLQVLLENGLLGLALLVAGILMAIGWCVRIWQRAQRPVHAALAAALFASLLATLVHALVDFAWYIPACMTLAIGILAASCRTAQLISCRETSEHNESSDRDPAVASDDGIRQYSVPRPVWAAAALVFALLAALVAPQRLGAAIGAMHWDDYLRQSASSANVLMQDSNEARSTIEKLIHHLSLTVQNDPYHPQAWQRLAALNLRRFDLEQQDADNVMDAAQIREAVFASQFSSLGESRKWLTRAIGPNLRYLRQAASCAQHAAGLGAWRGDAYLYLAELSFLFDLKPAVRQSLLAQAEEVRPHDGAVMFAIGVDELQRGELQRAIQRWKIAFHSNSELRRSIIEHVGPRAHPLAIIQAFAPDAESLQQLFDVYRAEGRKEFAALVAQHLEPALARRAKRSTSAVASAAWYQLADISWFLDQHEKSLQYLQRAVELAPDHYDWRRLYADRLLAEGDFAAAATEYRWCLERTPYDEGLQRALLTAEKQRRQQPETARRSQQQRSS